MNDLVRNVITSMAAKDNSAPGDYVESGVKFCGKCQAPKQTWIDFQLPGGRTDRRLVPVACLCKEQELAEANARERRANFDAWISGMIEQYGLSDRSYTRHTFAEDDRQDSAISDICLRYVERWEEMQADNMGILFYGSLGRGKSFFACAIVNALLEKCVPATVTNFPRLLNILQGVKERQAYIDQLQRYKLLVIDDLGVERDSTYAAEQVYNVIDARARSGLPLIVTTNLTMEDLKSPPTMQAARIYDRILEMCPIPIRMTGESRRTANASARKAKAHELLKGFSNG